MIGLEVDIQHPRLGKPYPAISYCVCRLLFFFGFCLWITVGCFKTYIMCQKWCEEHTRFFLWLGWLKGTYGLAKVMHFFLIFFSNFYEWKNRSLEFLTREVSHRLPLLGNFTTGQKSRTTWWTVIEFLSSPLLRHRYATWFEVGFCNYPWHFLKSGRQEKRRSGMHGNPIP